MYRVRQCLATHLIAGLGILACVHALAAQAVTAARTHVVILGTGTPIPDPDRFGPAVAVVVDSVPYLFDAGSGVMRRVAGALRCRMRAA